MSYFDQASLVMIPSGYKTSKVYSVKPTDGSGDLAFTRSNDTATRVGPDGLIEKVRTNLATYSEDFTNAAWTKIYATVTANSVANPLNGATTADTITPTTDVDVHRFRITSTGLSAGQVYTFSFYAKANGYNFVRIIENTTTGDVKQFNLSNGTIDTGTLSGQIVSLGNGWYRCAAQIVAASSQTIDVQIQSMAGTQGAFAGNGTSGVYVFGAQLELSDFGATDYIATTSAAVSVGPVANVPRLDYLNSSCPRLLLEPQRTNLVKYSEQFDNAVWNKDPATTTITANNAVSPDGYTNADLFGSSSPSAQAGVYQTILGLTPAATYYISAYVKLGTATNVCITVNNTVAWNTVGGQSFSAANGLNTNTWTRVGFSFTAPAGANINYHIGQHQQSGVDPQSLGTFLVWGAQVEAGAYATSYIPTLGAAVTRGADACSKTGISSLIGQTEGTVFCEVNFKTNDAGTYLSIEDWASLELVRLYSDAGPLNAQIYNSANVFISQTSYSAVVGQSYKMALAYSASGAAFYVNGVLVSQTTSALNIPTCSNVRLAAFTSGQEMNADIKQALLFKTRLTNAQLAELTTI